MKFKYISFETLFEEWELEHFKIVDCPLPYNDLPDGEYLIRGNKRSHRKKYWKFKDKWYLVNDVTKDNGHYDCDSAEYMLFPMLSEKEWQKIKGVPYKVLSPLWKRHIAGYTHWMQCRKLVRGIKLDYIKFK